MQRVWVTFPARTAHQLIKVHSSLKVKAKIRARGVRRLDYTGDTPSLRTRVQTGSPHTSGLCALPEARGQNWYNARQTEWARRKARTQAPFLLWMAGDWHGALENAKPHPKPHLMRAMLVANLDVENRFVAISVHT